MLQHIIEFQRFGLEHENDSKIKIVLKHFSLFLFLSLSFLNSLFLTFPCSKCLLTVDVIVFESYGATTQSQCKDSKRWNMKIKWHYRICSFSLNTTYEEDEEKTKTEISKKSFFCYTLVNLWISIESVGERVNSVWFWNYKELALVSP